MEDAAISPLLYDLPGIDAVVGLGYLGGKPQFYGQLLVKFRDSYGRKFGPDFGAAIASGDWKTARRLAHSLKSVARTLGIVRLGELAHGLERVAAEQDQTAAEPTSDELRRRVDLQFEDLLAELTLVVAGLESLDCAVAATPVSLAPVAGLVPTPEERGDAMRALPASTILIVDDAPENIEVMTGILCDEYRVVYASGGEDALALARAHPPSLILLDIQMPGLDGYEVCRQLKDDMRTRDIPVIFLTSMTEDRDEIIGLELGAVDYLHKPCKPAIVRRRVRNHLELRDQNLALETKVRERTRVLDETRVEIIRRLGRAAEYRDNETGMHVLRMSHSVHLLALAAGIHDAEARILLDAAPMHDVGKIGIPDSILLKPGKLDAAEWKIMKSHTVVGAEIIGEHEAILLRLARSLALTHHEKWDGSGYPNGLAGEAIPIEGRIAAIADVYDALTSERPYKRAWSSAEAAAYVKAEAGVSFDPYLAERFLTILPAVEALRQRYSDAPAAAAVATAGA